MILDLFRRAVTYRVSYGWFRLILVVAILVGALFSYE